MQTQLTQTITDQFLQIENGLLPNQNDSNLKSYIKVACLLLLLALHVYVYIWAFNSISNTFMHATNGNIDHASILALRDTFNQEFSHNRAVKVIKLMTADYITHYEHVSFIRNLDLIITQFNLNFDEAIILSNYEQWERYCEYLIEFLEDWCQTEKYVRNFIAPQELHQISGQRFDVDTMYSRFHRGWQSFLLSNKGMHSVNGNIDYELVHSLTEDFNEHSVYLVVHQLIPFEMFHMESAMLLDAILRSIALTNLEQMIDEARDWDSRYKYDRFFAHLIRDFEENFNTYKHIYMSQGVNSFRLLQMVKAGWQSYLLGNAGMHSMNGNTVSQMKFPAIPVDIQMESEDFVDALNGLTKAVNNGVEININHAMNEESRDIFVQSMENVFSSLTNTQVNANFGFDTNSIMEVGSIVLLIGTGVYYHRKPTTTNSMLFGASILFAMSKHGMIDVDLSSFIPKGNAPQMDSGDLQSLVTAVATLLCGYTCVKSPSEHLISNIVKSLSSFGRHTESLEKILKWSITAFETCVNFLRRHVLGTSSLSFLETGRADLDDYLERIRALDDKIHLNDFTFTVANSNMVHLLYQEGTKLLSRIPRDRESAPLCTALNHAISYIYKLKVKMDSMNLNLDGIRQEPASILMRGPPGMGKSQAMEHLCYKLLPHLVEPSKVQEALATPGHYIYNRQAENVFWEGYDYEKVICQFDDIGQARDVQGNPDNEIMNVIRAINIFQYNVHMAGIEQKGNVKFCSKLVVANTNMNTFDFQSIISPDAFFRRFDIIVDVVPRLEYCTEETKSLDLWKRKIDFSKLPIGCEGITSMHPSMLEFHDFKYSEGKLSGRVYTFEELCDSVIASHALKTQRFTQYQKELTTSKTRPQVDWSKFVKNRRQVAFSDNVLGRRVEEFISKFVKNPDYLQCSMMLSAWYHKHTGFDHKLEYIIAVYLSIKPEFESACDWSLETLGGYLIDPLNDIPLVPIIDMEVSEGILTCLVSKGREFSESLTSFVSLNCPRISTMTKVLVPVGTLLLTGLAFYKVYNVFFERDEVTVTGAPESYSVRVKPNKNFQKPPTMKQARGLIPNQPQAMMSHDKSNIEILNKIVARNVYEIVLPNTDSRCGFATFVRGNVFMVNRHFVTLCVANAMEDEDFVKESFKLRKPNTDIELIIPVKCILEFKVTDVLDDQDVAFIEAPRRIPQHPDIVKYFMSRNEVYKFTDLVFRLIINNHKDYRSWVGQATPIDSIAVEDTSVPYTIRNGYRYLATTEAGDCGSLFTLCNSHSGARKILGIHAAGNPSGYAFSTAVFEEDILEVLDMFDQQVIVLFEENAAPQCTLPFINKHVAPLYKHQKKISRPLKSKYLPSQLHGKVCPVTTAVAVTVPFYEDGVLIDPLDIALNKFGKNKNLIEEQYLEPITDQLYDDLVNSSTMKFDPRILTFEEAILGIENDPIFGAISRTTSPGFPLTHDANNRSKGKTYWLGSDVEYDLTTAACKKLKVDCLRVLDDAINGIRHEHIFADNPKDETLPKKKVAIHKIRLFNACPLVLLIVTRMLFGAFVRWYASNKIYNGSAVGVNPYSIDWELMRQQLEKFGNFRNKGAGDYACFDGSAMSQIHFEILKVIQKYYGDDGYSRARFVIFLELTNSRHINGSFVYEWVSSLPSGHPLTTVVNNLYNHYCFRFCWLASHNFEISCLPVFTKHVYLIVLGDDNIFSVSTEKIPIFNMSAIEQHMKLIGMTYTSDDKESKIGIMKTTEEITFLKRSFRKCDVLNRAVAPLSLVSITEMLNWTSGANPNQTVADNVATAYRELSLHRREIFDAFTSKIRFACQQENVPLPLTTSRLQNLLSTANLDAFY